jgi:hypothetical protein
MVDIGGKLRQIRAMIDDGLYFTINRARQYGKTTTLSQIRRLLHDEYICVQTSFEGLGDNPFATPEAFCLMFMDLVQHQLQFSSISKDTAYIDSWMDESATDFTLLGKHIAKMCKGKNIVLMIDEVDKTSNNRVYLHFLGMLRDKYLLRQDGDDYTFQSVILSGVYDVRNLKLKLINEGSTRKYGNPVSGYTDVSAGLVYTPAQTEGKMLNSPWNIATEFKVDMSFCPDEIATMLHAYEADHHSGMDINAIAEEIYSFTSGYPYLVSQTCKYIDEDLCADWTIDGVRDAVKLVLKARSTLTDDLVKNLESYSDMSEYLYELLIDGEEKSYSPTDNVAGWAMMFGFIKESNGKIVVGNEIFKQLITEYFIVIDSRRRDRHLKYQVKQAEVLSDAGRFDMELCLRKFSDFFEEMYSERDNDFYEHHGRIVFLSYMRPLLNGKGFCHIESELTDLRRMDVVIDYGSDQFVVELKLWRGEAEHKKAYKQLAGYLHKKGLKVGYLLTFDLRKAENREPKHKWVETDGVKVFDVRV